MTMQAPTSHVTPRIPALRRSPAATARGKRALLATLANAWFRLTLPLSAPEAELAPAERERLRRAQLGSLTLAGVFLLAPVGLPVALGGGVGLFRYGLLMVAAALALYQNRRGNVTAAGLLLVGGAEIGALLGFILPHGGQLSVLMLSLDLAFLVPELLAAVLLPPVSIFVVAGFNSLFVLVDPFVQPLSPDLRQLLATSAYGLIARPIMVQLFVALVGYLGIRVAADAHRRADDAEELARLRQREAEHQRQEAERSVALEEGMSHLQVILAQLANGNFHARVPALRDPRLWQVGKSLNHFIGRLERLAQQEFVLQREQEEAQRLAQAIYAMRAGGPPIWPAPTGLPLDGVVEALRIMCSSRPQPAARPALPTSATPSVPPMAATPLSLQPPAGLWRDALRQGADAQSAVRPQRARLTVRLEPLAPAEPLASPPRDQ
jgi:hypothetical protein